MMSLIDLLHALFFDYTLRTVALGAMTLGIVSGALGSFAVLRRQSWSAMQSPTLRSLAWYWLSCLLAAKNP
jgi:hypothetical protein